MHALYNVLSPVLIQLLIVSSPALLDVWSILKLSAPNKGKRFPVKKYGVDYLLPSKLSRFWTWRMSDGPLCAEFCGETAFSTILVRNRSFFRMEETATNWGRISNRSAVLYYLWQEVNSPIGIFFLVMLGFKLLFHFCPLHYYAISISEWEVRDKLTRRLKDNTC